MTAPNSQFDFSYHTAGPTTDRFHLSGGFVRGIMGPIGSGKSVACCMEIFRRAIQQSRRTGNARTRKIRRTRWAIIRNTYPELKSTTIKTWTDWFPTHVFGPINWSAPITHKIRFNDIDIEVLFLALDRPEDIGKLLSLELTGVWINEAREIPKAILDAATGRVGRFPAKRDGGCTWSGVIMDTNPPDDDHWWYRLAEEPDADPAMAKQTRKLEETLQAAGVLPVGSRLYEFFHQPSGLSPKAENKNNLPAGYYERLIPGKSKVWVDCYVHGKYSSIQDGKAIYEDEYNDAIHVSPAPLEPIPGRTLYLGWDFGLTPACIVGQISPLGQLRILREYCAESIGIRRFAETVVIPELEREFHGWPRESVGDPAGKQRAQTDEKTALDILNEVGVPTSIAESNVETARWDAVKWFLTRMVDRGQPAFVLDPSCKTLRKGFNGGYQLRRIQVSGDERFESHAFKNRFSHPHDGLQYLAMRAKGAAYWPGYQQPRDESPAEPEPVEDY